jgi:hypothetical protein
MAQSLEHVESTGYILCAEENPRETHNVKGQYPASKPPYGGRLSDVQSAAGNPPLNGKDATVNRSPYYESPIRSMPQTPKQHCDQ